MESRLGGVNLPNHVIYENQDRRTMIEERLPRSAEEIALWALFRQVRGSYQSVCRLLVQRGLLAEMPADLDKPIKV